MIINDLIKRGKMAAWVFKKEAYEKTGGYDPKNDYGEDVDLAKRIQQAGYKVLYEPTALWLHKWEDTPISLIKKHFTVGRLNFYHRRKSPLTFLKVIYFLSVLPLITLVVVGMLPSTGLLVHAAPLIVVGSYRFYLCRKSPNRFYMLLYPLIAYLINIPYSLGFISKILYPNKASSSLDDVDSVDEAASKPLSM